MNLRIRRGGTSGRVTGNTGKKKVLPEARVMGGAAQEAGATGAAAAVGRGRAHGCRFDRFLGVTVLSDLWEGGGVKAKLRGPGDAPQGQVLKSSLGTMSNRDPRIHHPNLHPQFLARELLPVS